MLLAIFICYADFSLVNSQQCYRYALFLPRSWNANLSKNIYWQLRNKEACDYGDPYILKQTHVDEVVNNLAWIFRVKICGQKFRFCGKQNGILHLLPLQMQKPLLGDFVFFPEVYWSFKHVLVIDVGNCCFSLEIWHGNGPFGSPSPH